MEHGVEAAEQRGVEVETFGVELEAFDEAASGRVDVVGPADGRVVGVGRSEEPAAGRDLARGGDAAFDVSPELGQVGRSGEDPPDPDDGHPIIRHHGRSTVHLDSTWAGRFRRKADLREASITHS